MRERVLLRSERRLGRSCFVDITEIFVEPELGAGAGAGNLELEQIFVME